MVLGSRLIALSPDFYEVALILFAHAHTERKPKRRTGPCVAVEVIGLPYRRNEP